MKQSKPNSGSSRNKPSQKEPKEIKNDTKFANKFNNNVSDDFGKHQLSHKERKHQTEKSPKDQHQASDSGTSESKEASLGDHHHQSLTKKPSKTADRNSSKNSRQDHKHKEPQIPSGKF
jgi:hypothetical protein